MRLIIDKFLYTHNKCYLLVADLGKFPLMLTTNRYLDVGLSESLMVNIAIGLASEGKKVFIYSAGNFTLYRAFDQIKHLINISECLANKKLDITFLNAGSGFIYSKFGITHHLTDDIVILDKLCPNIQHIYIPYDLKTTEFILNKTYNNLQLNYIRLCPDNSKSIVKLSKKRLPKIIIYTFGWLVDEIQNIINENNLNITIYPILDYKKQKYIKNGIAIYDSIPLELFKNVKSLSFSNFPKEYLANNKSDALNYYKFDTNTIKKFILLHYI